ncbi:unnamed protein product [Phaeothamnion confervicola]
MSAVLALVDGPADRRGRCDVAHHQWLSLCVAAAGFSPMPSKASGAQRFNVYGPARLVRGDVDPWYKNFHAHDYGETGLFMPTGMHCCAADLVSFHYVMPAEQAHLYDMVYHRERHAALTPAQLAAAWPEEHVDVAFRPREEDDDVWTLLLQKLQVCSG